MEKANSFIGSRGSKSVENAAIIIVDPFSTGAHLALAVTNAGYKCARVFSIWDSPVAALVQEGLTLDFSATIQHNDRAHDQDAATNDTVAAIKVHYHSLSYLIRHIQRYDIKIPLLPLSFPR